MFDFAYKFVELLVVTLISLFFGAINGVVEFFTATINAAPGVFFITIGFIILSIISGCQLFPYLIENGRRLEENDA